MVSDPGTRFPDFRTDPQICSGSADPSGSPETWSQVRSDLRSQKSGLAAKSRVWPPKCRNPEILGNPGNPGFRTNPDFSGKVGISAKSWIPGSDRIPDSPHTGVYLRVQMSLPCAHCCQKQRPTSCALHVRTCNHTLTHIIRVKGKLMTCINLVLDCTILDNRAL
jgi:hypothetical protein